MSFGIKEDRYAEERYKSEEIVAKLRQVDVLVSQGVSMADAGDDRVQELRRRSSRPVNQVSTCYGV
jgi:hypothetical protein